MGLVVGDQLASEEGEDMSRCKHTICCSVVGQGVACGGRRCSATRTYVVHLAKGYGQLFQKPLRRYQSNYHRRNFAVDVSQGYVKRGQRLLQRRLLRLCRCDEFDVG